MKQRRRANILMLVGGIVALLGIVALAIYGVAGDAGWDFNVTFLLLIFFICAVVAAVCYFAASSMLKVPDPELAAKRQKYLSYPVNKIEDFKEEIEITRANFKADNSPDKNAIPKVKPTKKGKPFYDMSVIQSGNVYYACLVEANSLLFKENYTNLIMPAVVLYSTDEYYDSNPHELYKIASSFYDNKRNNVLRNDLKYFSNYKVETPEGRNVYMTTIMINRLHLPLGFISGRIFPIVADPENCTSVFVADPEYWSKNLVGNYCHNIV